MGLDQYAYKKDSEGNGTEIAYWRKHPFLQGWMENLWLKKTDSPVPFNLQPVILTLEDLDDLESAVQNGTLPETEGFFFGSDASDYYREEDLMFIDNARQAIRDGFTVEYSSWW